LFDDNLSHIILSATIKLKGEKYLVNYFKSTEVWKQQWVDSANSVSKSEALLIISFIFNVEDLTKSLKLNVRNKLHWKGTFTKHRI